MPRGLLTSGLVIFLVVLSCLSLSVGLYQFLLTPPHYQQQPISHTAVLTPHTNPSSICFAMSSLEQSPEKSMWEDGSQLYKDIAVIPDGSAPEASWLPIYNRRTPYNEDEIVNLINEIIRNFIRLSDVDEDEVLWPPEGGHALNQDLCDELNVSEAARSLMRRLPSVTGQTGSVVNLFQASRLFFITEDFGLRQSRVAPPSQEELEYPVEGSVLPQDVQLAAGDRESSSIILDTQENTIRVASGAEWPDVMNPPNTPLERPEDPNFYRNYWPCHAPTWLRVQLNKIKALDTIPPGHSQFYGTYVDYSYEWLRRKIKLILIGTYGWPDDFQQAAWDQDREQVWEDAVQEYEKLGEPRVLKCY